MKVSVDWTDDVSFLATSPGGHTVAMDGPPDKGGKDKGPRPMELLLMGMGGCASFDVVSMLKKGRQDIVDCRAVLQAERADAVPAVFTKIHIEFQISGNNLKESQVKRAVALSAEKYCSASIMLGKAGVDITHSYVINETAS